VIGKKKTIQKYVGESEFRSQCLGVVSYRGAADLALEEEGELKPLHDMIIDSINTNLLREIGIEVVSAQMRMQKPTPPPRADGSDLIMIKELKAKVVDHDKLVKTFPLGEWSKWGVGVVANLEGLEATAMGELRIFFGSDDIRRLRCGAAYHPPKGKSREHNYHLWISCVVMEITSIKGGGLVRAANTEKVLSLINNAVQGVIDVHMPFCLGCPPVEFNTLDGQEFQAEKFQWEQATKKYPLIVLVPISELNFFGSKWMIQKSRLEGDTSVDAAFTDQKSMVSNFVPRNMSIGKALTWTSGDKKGNASRSFPLFTEMAPVVEENGQLMLQYRADRIDHPDKTNARYNG
jgi:hypothetical protein